MLDSAGQYNGTTQCSAPFSATPNNNPIGGPNIKPSRNIWTSTFLTGTSSYIYYCSTTSCTSGLKYLYTTQTSVTLMPYLCQTQDTTATKDFSRP